MLNLKETDKSTWVRMIILVLSLINMLLCNLGITGFKNVDFNGWYDGISNLLTVIVALVCAWKNNSFTDAAQFADYIMKNMRINGIEPTLPDAPKDDTTKG